MRHFAVLLTVTACLLSGCTAAEGPDEAPAPSPDEAAHGSNRTSHPGPTTPGAGDAGPLLRWNVTDGGDAALRFTVASEGTVQCTLEARYHPGGAVGWDGVVMLSGSVDSWMIVGSTWHDVVLHAGPLDSRDHLDGFHDDGAMDLGWTWDNAGTTTVLVAALETAPTGPEGAPGFAAAFHCVDDVVLADVAWGTEVLLQALTDGDGAGASARDPVVGLDGGAFATSSASTFGAPLVVGAIATLGSDVAVVDVAGPASERFVFGPSLEPPPVEHFSGGPGQYTVTAVGGGPFSSAWTVLAGLVPSPPPAVVGKEP